MILEIVLKWNSLPNISLIGTYAFSQITKFFSWLGDTEVQGVSTASEVQQGRAVTGVMYDIFECQSPDAVHSWLNRRHF